MPVCGPNSRIRNLMNVWIPALLSVLVVSVISLVGIIAIALREKTLYKLLVILVSFSAGALLGDSFFHLLPRAVGNSGSFAFNISFFVLIGILSFFVLEKVVLWRHCHHLLDEGAECKVHTSKPFATMNLIGDGVHNLLDGLVIGGSYAVNFGLGLTTTLAVIFHEIPQEIGDFGVLVAGGYSRGRALLFNFLTAITSFVGVVIALLLTSSIANFTIFLVPFTAGGFIYIAASDLIPELHKQTPTIKKVLIELLSFSLGIVLMWLLIFIE